MRKIRTGVPAPSDRDERERDGVVFRDHLPVPVALVDREFLHRRVNRAYVEWAGSSRAALRRSSLRSVFGDAAFARAEPHFRAALGGEPRRYRDRVRAGCGGTREVDAVFLPWRSGPGRQIEGVVVLAVEVPGAERADAVRLVMTEAGRLLSAAIDPELALASLVRLVVGRFADGAQACILRSGNRLHCLSTRGADQPVTERVLDPGDLPDPERDALVDGSARFHSDLEDRWTYLIEPIHGSAGCLGLLRFGWAPPFDAEQEDTEVGRDLARRMAAAFEHARMDRLAREAVLQRDWVLERTLHDLSGPTASIWMVADRLLRRAPDPDRRTSRAQIDAIAQQSKELERLITDLRAATQLTAGYALVEHKATDALGVLREVAARLEPVASWHGNPIRVLEPARPMPWVSADPYHLRRLLSALVMHAVRRSASAEGIDLALAWEPGPGEVRFEVRGPSVGPSSGGQADSLDLEIAGAIARALRAGLDLGADDGRVVASFTLPRADERLHGSPSSLDRS